MAFRVILGFITLAAWLTGPVAAERKVALVIGNGAYTNAPKLANPINDAAAVARHGKLPPRRHEELPPPLS